jgi:hypothetical protein
MGIFDRFHKRSEAAGDTRRNNHVAALTARLEGPDKKNSVRAGIDLGQIIREDAEQLGDSILEVYVTSTGSAGTWSSEENVMKFVNKYNDLLTRYEY